MVSLAKPGGEQSIHAMLKFGAGEDVEEGGGAQGQQHVDDRECDRRIHSRGQWDAHAAADLPHAHWLLDAELVL